VQAKNVGKNHRKKVRNSASRKCWEKTPQKIPKKRFLYSHEYHDQKWGEKTRETIFPETHEECEKNMLGKKSLEKSAKTRFL